MKRHWLLSVSAIRTAASLLALACLLLSAANQLQGAGANEAKPVVKVDFIRDVQPIFTSHCIECHGPKQQKGGLRVDVKDQMFSRHDSGKSAIVAGKVAESHLIALVREDEPGEVMPPKGKPLSKTQIDTLIRWIEQGADWPAAAATGAVLETDHWAFQPVKNPPLPQVSNGAWVKSPIDRFILATLESRSIAPSPAADRYTLIRRLSYDLIGLPPTPTEVDAFVNDHAADAYDKLVDRLLASPHFGERWGRHWLDMARYADSDGYEKDNPRPNAWRYRDWVIQAINDDLPFDQFTIEQLAGDLLPQATPMQKLATAFHRQTLTNTEGGADREEFRTEATFDRTETTGSIWMGMTLNCTRCHSHKYDPITQREYFQLFAFFNAADEAGLDVPVSDDAVNQHRLAMKVHEEKVSSLEDQFAQAKGQLQPKIAAWEAEMAAKLAAAKTPVQFDSLKIIEAKSISGASLQALEDGSILVSGPAPDKDKYTIIFEGPTLPLTGLRIETLTHKDLPSTGPGRTAHGNFVLTELRGFISGDRDFKKHERIPFASAEADFAQGKFPPGNVLVAGGQTGWAISPQMGKDHHLTAFTGQPVDFSSRRFLQVVLDQQYGGGHTIGRFRITAMTGFDPLRSLPAPIVAALKVAPAKRTQVQRDQIGNHVASLDPQAGKLVKDLDALKKNPPKSPMMSVPIMKQAARTTRLLHRGDFLQPAEPVAPGALAAVTRVHPITGRSGNGELDRLDLARWLVDVKHPLTARVSVNHIWARLMGQGLVGTVNDFGLRGEEPTHPLLLDWLAYHWPRDLRWSRKALIKAIVTSATYQQASVHRPELVQIDPTNRLLARQNRMRVEAETVRDLHLATSGLLSSKVGGPSVFPPLPAGVAELSYANNFKWNTSTGEDRHRRGMYTFFKRTAPHPTLITFDCPDSNTARLQRDMSNTPLQALVTLNNEVFLEAAQAMARRVLSEVNGDDHARLTFAIRLCIARKPGSGEVETFTTLLAQARQHYAAHEEDAKKLAIHHRAEAVSVAENAAWVATVRMIMNLDEFIVRD